jgi:hypothetical protein
MIDDDRSYSDAELGTLDLAAVFAGGIVGEDGRMRPELQGIGSVAAAIQLDNQFVTSGQVADAASFKADGFAPPALDHVLRLGLAASRDDTERAVFGQWLGMVAAQLVLRERNRT